MIQLDENAIYTTNDIQDLFGFNKNYMAFLIKQGLLVPSCLARKHYFTSKDIMNMLAAAKSTGEVEESEGNNISSTHNENSIQKNSSLIDEAATVIHVDPTAKKNILNNSINLTQIKQELNAYEYYDECVYSIIDNSRSVEELLHNSSFIICNVSDDYIANLKHFFEKLKSVVVA